MVLMEGALKRDLPASGPKTHLLCHPARLAED